MYFCFDYVHRNDRETDENIIPSDWHDTGFCFTLNYLRPTFFAYEAMPIVEEFANEFQLFIADAQDERSHGPIVPNLCHSNELIESWKRSNVTAVKAHQKLHGDINYMPEEQSRLWWQYSREKSRLQKQLGCTIFVPSIFIFKKQKEPGLLTAISWTEGISQVFPESDYIIIIRNQVRNSTPGFVSSHEIYSKLDKYIEAFDGSVRNMRILKPDKAKQVKEISKALEIKVFPDIKRIAPDQFVDDGF